MFLQMNLRTFLNQCFAPAVLSLRLFFVVKNRRAYGVMNVAIASFLAGTRNLMFMDCLVRSFIVGVCACIEIRFLVRVRDDIVGVCGILWVLTVF